MSICRNMLGIISLAVASCLAGAKSAGGTDLAAARVLAMSGPGIGELASLPSGEARQSVIADAATGPANSDATSPVETYFANWFARVDQARESQPHWLPPLMTLSPLITELLREDAYYQWMGNGSRLLNLGASKGLFLVPTKTNEVDFGIPAYQERYAVQPAAGLADWQFLLVKQRLFSANAQEGNYVVTAALAAQAPTGAQPFTNDAFVITPTLAAGKGFGNLNIQAATSLVIPTVHEDTLGTTWRTNVAFQYQLAEIFWPEFEVNWAHWLDGSQRSGLHEVFLTVGALFGPFPIGGRVAIVVGGGFQFAVAPAQRLAPALTPEYQSNIIFSGRIVF
jgi:hypothetical protein